MARIIVRNTAVSGSKPTSLVQGELSLNVTDGKLYYGSSSRNIVKEFTGSASGGGGSSVSASYAVTASYALTSSYATNFTVSGSITSVDYIDFDTSASVTQPVPGRLSWNDADGTLDIGLKGSNVTLQVGQETVARVVNKTGGNLLEADYAVVRVRSVAEGGAQGQRLAVVLAQADNDANSATTLGIVTEDITVNQEGFITLSGQVRKINTTGTLQGETWVDGDVLYLSPTTPGYLTNIKPQAPQHTVIVGYVEYAHINQGKIFVKVDNGYEIDELHNVRIDTGSLIPGQLLVRSGSLWTNSNQLTGSYGLTGSLTVSGSLNISGSTNAFIQGGNSFGATALLGTNDNQSLALETSGSTRMFISSSGRIGMGTSTPSASMHIAGDLRLASAADGANALWFLRNSNNNWSLQSVNGVGEIWRVAGNSQTFYQVGTFANGLNVTPGGNSTTQGLIITSGSYPAATLLRVGVNSLVVTGSNVGIGTLTPVSTLHVNGTGNDLLTVGYAGNNTNMVVGSGGTTSIRSGWGNGGAFITTTGGTTLFLQAGPNSTAPTDARVTLGMPLNNGAFKGGASGSLHIRGYTSSSLSASLYIENLNASASFVVRDSGNVGIGTNTPSTTLDVSGSGRFTNGLTVTGSLIATSFSGSLFGTSSWATNSLTASSIAPAITTNTNGNILTATGTGTVEGEPLLTWDGTKLSVLYQAGDEGGEILLGKPATNTTLTGSGITIDSYQDRLRFFEQGGAARGAYIDIAGCVGGVGSPIAKEVAEQVYTGAIAWTGTAAPSGSTNHTYRWSQTGKTVNLNIVLSYTGPGNAVSTVTTALPADCPTPYVPSGQSGAGALISVVSAHLTTTNTIGANIARGGLRINSTNNGYELSATATAAGYKTLVTSVQYFAV